MRPHVPSHFSVQETDLFPFRAHFPHWGEGWVYELVTLADLKSDRHSSNR